MERIKNIHNNFQMTNKKNQANLNNSKEDNKDILSQELHINFKINRNKMIKNNRNRI